MIDIRSQLTIKHDDNATFATYSQEMATFGRDGVALTVTSAEDYIYVGFEKPINAFYVDITTANGVAGTSTLEYYNGSTWAAVTNKSDDTQGLFRSGFVRWDRELTDHATTAVDSSTLYWYRMKPSLDRTAIVVSGIGLVFSDDYELSLEQPLISDTSFLGDESSHIKYHSATKREIIQKFRNQNYIKYDATTGEKEDINCWDLLDIDEVKLASTYLTLAKIYSALSDNPDDTWSEKNKQFKMKYDEYIKLARLSIDIDDDGLLADSENKIPMKNRFMHR